MTRYDLTCHAGHRFDGWFASFASFDDQKAHGLLTCPACGSEQIEKALMAPAVIQNAAAGSTFAPRTPQEVALAALRAKVESSSEYVGLNFVTEARAMHAGDVPERAIYGEAKYEDAKALIEDGVPVAPLPFIPTRKSN